MHSSAVSNHTPPEVLLIHGLAFPATEEETNPVLCSEEELQLSPGVSHPSTATKLLECWKMGGSSQLGQAGCWKPHSSIAPCTESLASPALAQNIPQNHCRASREFQFFPLWKLTKTWQGSLGAAEEPLQGFGIWEKLRVVF